MHRQIILLSGEHEACLEVAKKLIKVQGSQSKKNIDVVSVADYTSKNCLGQEFDVAIVDLFELLDANAFGAITGTVRGGGALILLLPEKAIFPQSLFLQRFMRILKNSHFDKLVSRIDTNKNNQQFVSLLVPGKIHYSTKDQKKAIEAIIHVVSGHRRRPLLISADRGRGKSAALGLAAAMLLERGQCQHIIVCAPSRKTAEVVFRHAADTEGLHFYVPYELLRLPIKTDLLLIDEAAAIPLSLLNQLLKKYSRIVFATTLHGYEGSGRGFVTRFQKTLNEKASGWKHCQLHKPIRWAENDPLEKFTFDALLLNAEPVDGSIIKNTKLANCNFSLINKSDLIKQESRLSGLFGLLVAAHYQTKPSDLQQLLDDKTISLFTIEHEAKIVATALVTREGGFDQEMARQIFAGIRRPKGNLVAQALAANAGIENAPCLIGDRIVRLAVHPELQQQGFGRALLDYIVNQSIADYVSCSFGATADLLKFWKPSGFLPATVGVKRDASSGAHSVILLKGKTEKGQQLTKYANARFITRFPHMLADTLRDLEADVVCQLLQADKRKALDNSERNEVAAFADQQRSYENSLYSLWKLLCSSSSMENLSVLERDILIMKILQKQPWQIITERMQQKISGKKQGLLLLREAIKKLMPAHHLH